MQCKMQQFRATWYCQKSWPEMVPEVVRAITVSGTGSHDRKWYRKSWPEVAPEVMTGSGTGSHDRKWHWKSWPEDMTGSDTGSHDRKWQTDRQTDTECFIFGNIPCIADISSIILSAGLSSRNCFDTGRTQNPELRTQKSGRGNQSRREHSPNYYLSPLKVGVTPIFDSVGTSD